MTGVQVAEKNAAQKQAAHQTYCNGDYDHDCFRDTAKDERARTAPELTIEDARKHALTYVNGARYLKGAVPLELDADLNAFAQEGSEQLSRDHRAHRHIEDNAARCAGCAENQGDANGCAPEPLADQIDGALAAMMNEGPGGAHHDNMLDPRWRRLGVGIVNPGGPMYLTIDFAP